MQSAISNFLFLNLHRIHQFIDSKLINDPFVKKSLFPEGLTKVQ